MGLAVGLYKWWYGPPVFMLRWVEIHFWLLSGLYRPTRSPVALSSTSDRTIPRGIAPWENNSKTVGALNFSVH